MQELNTARLALEKDIAGLQAAHRITRIAIGKEANSSFEYRDNLRRFYEIALPKIEQAKRRARGNFERHHADIMDSFKELEHRVDDVEVREIGNKDKVLAALRRHWRKLGSSEATPYEPLWKFVTGHYLNLE